MEYQLANNNWIDDRYGSRQYNSFFFSIEREAVERRYKQEIQLLKSVLGIKITHSANCNEPDIWFRATERMGKRGYCYWVAVDILEKFRDKIAEKAKENEKVVRLSKTEKELYQEILKGISNPFSFMKNDKKNRGIRRTVKSLVNKELIYSEATSDGLRYYPCNCKRITEGEKEYVINLIEKVQAYDNGSMSSDEFIRLLNLANDNGEDFLNKLLVKLKTLDWTSPT